MATVKKIKKAQSGVTKKPTAFQSYVKKYPGSGSDTTARIDPRNNYTNDGFAGTHAKQNSDLKSAFTKTYGKKDMTGIDQDDEAKYRVPQKKKGGIIKKAQTGVVTPVKKGASGPGVTGIRKAVYKEAAKQFGLDKLLNRKQEISIDKMMDWKKDIAKKPNYKKGGIIKKTKSDSKVIKKIVKKK
jgi:hypothetical protein